ncbi:MAG: cell wall-binding repeat-containing protein [Coriobacteriia bacterium]
MLAATLLPVGAVATEMPQGANAAREAKVARTTLTKGEPQSTGIVPLDADDSIAGALVLPASPVGGSLDSTTDVSDVFKLVVPSGSRLSLTLTGSAALNADAYVFDPTATDIDADVALAGTIGDAFPKAVAFDIPAAAGGTYYVAVCAAAGSGAYTLGWELVALPSGPDDDAPGVALGVSPMAGSLTAVSDSADVFAVSLAAGQRLVATLDGPADADFDLRLFAPGTTSVYGALPVWGAATATADETLIFDAATGAGGTYLLDVHAVSGSGAYTLTWSVTAVPAGTWETSADAATISSTGGTLMSALDRVTDANDFYRLTLAAGDRLTLSLIGAAGSDFDAYIYSAAGSEPLAFANDTVYPETVVCDIAVAGTYFVEIEAFGGSGAYTLVWSVGDTPEWTGTDRIAGSNRYTTAVALSASAFAADSADTVVLATGVAFADALAASGLAGCYEGPLLLTDTNSVPASVLGELDRVGASRVVIIGGTVAVSSGVAGSLVNAGYAVSRIQGTNRYDTAAKVAAEIARLQGADFVHGAFVARGDQFADALAVSPFAYSRKMPVLLTPTASLSTETRTAITSLAIEDVYVAGGIAAVSDGVKNAIDQLPGTTRPVVRLAGANRYATATVIAEYGIDFYWASAGFVGVATGSNFPDALGGGAVCGARGGVLLMTAPTELSAAPALFITTHKDEVLDTQVFGGDAAVSAAVKSQIDALLN